MGADVQFRSGRCHVKRWRSHRIAPPALRSASLSRSPTSPRAPPSPDRAVGGGCNQVPTWKLHDRREVYARCSPSNSKARKKEAEWRDGVRTLRKSPPDLATRVE